MNTTHPIPQSFGLQLLRPDLGIFQKIPPLTGALAHRRANSPIYDHRKTPDHARWMRKLMCSSMGIFGDLPANTPVPSLSTLRRPHMRDDVFLFCYILFIASTDTPNKQKQYLRRLARAHRRASTPHHDHHRHQTTI